MYLSILRRTIPTTFVTLILKGETELRSLNWWSHSFSAGVIYDLSQSYQIAFYVAGACSTVATCILFLVPALMPQETIPDTPDRAETAHSKDIEKPLIRICSPDSSNPTTSTKASLGSCQKLNSTLHLAPSQSYLDRYWGIPKRASMRASASMASLLSFGPVQPGREVLLVVDRVSQVWVKAECFKLRDPLFRIQQAQRVPWVIKRNYISTQNVTSFASAENCVTTYKSRNFDHASWTRAPRVARVTTNIKRHISLTCGNCSPRAHYLFIPNWHKQQENIGKEKMSSSSTIIVFWP